MLLLVVVIDAALFSHICGHQVSDSFMGVCVATCRQKTLIGHHRVELLELIMIGQVETCSHDAISI